MKYLLMILMLAGCGSEPNPDYTTNRLVNKPVEVPEAPEPEIDLELQPVLDSFIAAARDRGVALPLLDRLSSMRFEDPNEGTVVGRCTRYMYGDRVEYLEIIIHPDYRNQVDSRAFEGLVFHELGHCLLQLDHAQIGSKHIMEPAMLSDQYYEDNWDELVNSLFN